MPNKGALLLFVILASASAVPVSESEEEQIVLTTIESVKESGSSGNVTDAEGRQSPIDPYLSMIGNIAQPIVASVSPIVNAVGPIISNTISQVYANVMSFVGNQTSSANVNITASSPTKRPTLKLPVDAALETARSEQISGEIAGTLEEFMLRKVMKADEYADDNRESELRTNRKPKRPIKKATQAALNATKTRGD